MQPKPYPPRKNAIFTVLNDWFDIDQTTFEKIWPELEKATKTPNTPHPPKNNLRTNNYVEELKRRIHHLIQTLQQNNGEMDIQELSLKTAQKAEIYTKDMPYVITSAQADNLITVSLRTGKVKLIQQP